MAAARQKAEGAVAAGANFFRNFLKEVGGYTTRSGIEVADYVRWRAGLAGVMNQVVAARHLGWLKYADRADWPLAVLAAGIAGYDQLQSDHGSGHRYTDGQEAARVGFAATLSGGETIGAGVAGMAIGAAVGSIVPGPGTLAGASVGFLLGAGLAVGGGVAIDHFHVNDWIKQRVFEVAPDVFGT
jgi:hypothetical protein